MRAIPARIGERVKAARDRLLAWYQSTGRSLRAANLRRRRSARAAREKICRAAATWPWAMVLRHWRIIAMIGVIAVLFSFSFWYLKHLPAHLDDTLKDSPGATVWDRHFARDANDTANADAYYLVNIFFVPAQTMLVLLAGVIAWSTFGQGHRFKQYDVESNCIREYSSLEDRLATATTDDEIVRIVRQYWVLMLFEYYWWRKDLLSREIFTNWCEFRRQRFAKNYDFPSKADPTKKLVFNNYQGSYAYFRDSGAFPKNIKFRKLMDFLIEKSKRKTPVRWHEIEHFRHGFDRSI